MTYHNGSGSSTMVIELPSITSTTANSRVASTKDVAYISETARTLSSSTPPPPEGQLPAPITAHPQLTRWNYPRSNMFRVMSAFWSFIILGANDGAIGALIPYLESYYKIDYTVISLIFLSPTAGFIVSALTNNMVHVHFGQRGIAIMMCTCHLIAYTILSQHPPYPVIVVTCVIAGYGNGLGDSAWNAWIGDMANPNELLGFLHAFYGLGAALAPFVATTVITKAGWHWYEYYYLMIGGAAIEAVVLTISFWKSTAAVWHATHTAQVTTQDSGTSTPLTDLNTGGINPQSHPQPTPTPNTQPNTQPKRPWYNRINPFKNPNSRTAEAARNRVTIISSVFLLVYVGAEVAIGGWIVTFMLRVRGGSPFASGMVSTGFWLGITVGRMVLGFVTGRLFKTEKHAVATYMLFCIVLQLLFWLIPRFLVSAVMVSLLGFFLAPMFPAAVVAMTRLLPKRLHVASIGFASALGAGGACVFPFGVGAIANARGVEVLQPVVLAMLVVLLGVWLCIPKLPKQRTQ